MGIGDFFSSKARLEVVVNGRVLPAESFDYTSDDHLRLITQQIARYDTALKNLQQIDRNIFLGGVLTIGALAGDFIFPFAWLASLSSGVFGYNMALRSQSYVQFREAQEDLIKIYEWTMGKNTRNHWYKLAVTEIQELIKALGPWVSKETIHTWTEADLKPAMAESFISPRRNDIPHDFEKLLGQLAAGTQSTNWRFRIYGENGMGMGELTLSLATTLVSKTVDASAKLWASHPPNLKLS